MKKFLSVGKFDNCYDVKESKTDRYGFGISFGEIIFDGKKYSVISHKGGLDGVGAEFIKLVGKNIWIVQFNNNREYPNMLRILKILDLI